MTAGLFCKDFTFFDFRGIKTCFLLKFVPQMQFLNKHFSLLGWNEGEEAVQIHQNDPQRDWISEQQAEKD